MRTSQSQFELIIDYMERHGDLNKPGVGPQERVAIIQHWDKLTKALNIDIRGAKKSIEKWKKVWSDLKNNTKRKATKIHKAINQNGDGPPICVKLSSLEQRVLNVVKAQAVTGLPEVNEVGCELAPTAAPIERAGPSPRNVVLTPDSTPTVLIESSLENEKLYIKQEDGQFTLLSSIEVDCSPHSQESMQDETHVTPRASPSPRVITSHRSTSQRRTKRNFPRASTAPGHSASRYFVESDERWRSLFNKLATEHFRLREAELQQQAQWQVLFGKMITTLNKFAE